MYNECQYLCMVYLNNSLNSFIVSILVPVEKNIYRIILVLKESDIYIGQQEILKNTIELLSDWHIIAYVS